MPTRRKGNPPYPNVTSSASRNPLFGEADAARARKDAGLPYVAGMDDEKVAHGITHAFASALMCHGLDKRNAAPFVRRDYFARVGQAARRLLDELGLAELAHLENAALGSEITLRHGYRHLLNEVPSTSEAGTDHYWLARLARDIGQSPTDHEMEFRRVWALPGEPEPSHERIAESFKTSVLSDALERSVLGIAYLIAIAERGERRWKDRRATRSPDGFHVSLMPLLARLYVEAFGEPPRVKQRNGEYDLPAAHWIDAVIVIAAENADRAPSFSDDEAAPFDPVDLLRTLASKWKPETTAEYLRRGWKRAQRKDAQRPQQMNPD